MRFNEFNEEINPPGKPQPGGKNAGDAKYTPMKFGPFKYDFFQSPTPKVTNMPPSPEPPANYEHPPKMRQPTSQNTPQPWMTRPGLDEPKYTEQPAYQRANKPDPYMQDISNKLDKLEKERGKPRVDIKDVQARRELEKQLQDPRPSVWQNPRTGEISKSPPPANVELPKPSPKPLSTNLPPDKIGSTRPGYDNAPAVWKNPRNPNEPASSVPPVTSTKPTTSTTQPSAFSQAMNTVSQMRKGMGKGSEYTNVYAPMGTTNFMDQQYIKDLEKELAKTPNDPIISAELDRMRNITKNQPNVQTKPQAQTTDAKQQAPITPTQTNNPVKDLANKQAASRGMSGRGSQSTVKSTPPANVAKPITPTTEPNVAKPNASAGTSAPTTVQSIDTSKNPKQVSTPPAPAAATSKSMPPVPTTQQSNTDYKGTKGAQSLMALNPDKIQNVNRITAGDTINLGGDKSYTIKQGDTLDRIAANQLSSPTNVATPPAPPTQAAEKDPTQNNTNSSTQADESLNRMKSLAGIK